jgi:hypothetical protein
MSWWDRIVDWGAEAIGGYEDYEDIAGGVSAGQQLISDVDDFLESDTFGFIKKGAKAYGMLSGTIDAEGNRIKGAQQPFKQTQIYKAPRSYKGMFPGSGGTPSYQASQVNMAVGANNPNIQTALAALMNASYNTQMNNVVSQFTVSPTIGQGRKTAVGTTSLQRSQRTRAV